jgi:hypothetical protein
MPRWGRIVLPEPRPTKSPTSTARLKSGAYSPYKLISPGRAEIFAPPIFGQPTPFLPQQSSALALHSFVVRDMGHRLIVASRSDVDLYVFAGAADH